jgi:hypothetical protein
MTGALRTTATDTLEAHANLLPLDLCIQNLCHQATIRLASHPNSHPLTPLLRRTSKLYVKKHKSSLHHLTHTYDLNPDTIEKIHPSCHHPNTTSPTSPEYQKQGKSPYTYMTNEYKAQESTRTDQASMEE